MTYIILFFEFLKIGAFTFGGGYAMIPFIQETVLKHEWLTNQELIDFIAVSESTPGAFAVNISTYVGSQVGGFFGAVCATIGVILPAFIIILIIAEIYAAREKNIYKISSQQLADKIKELHPEKSVRYIESFEGIAEYVKANAERGDLVLTMGAGDIYKVGDLILDK